MEYKYGDSVIFERSSTYKPRYAIISKIRELDMDLIVQNYRRDDPVVMAIIWITKFKYQDYYNTGRILKNHSLNFDFTVNLE